MWECGLKLQLHQPARPPTRVTPYVGVWIETPFKKEIENRLNVTPYVGVWIET